jgi:hypothetical protein
VRVFALKMHKENLRKRKSVKSKEKGKRSWKQTRCGRVAMERKKTKDLPRSMKTGADITSILNESQMMGLGLWASLAECEVGTRMSVTDRGER